MNLLRTYWFAATVLIAGTVATFAIGFSGGSVGAVVWSCAAVGVLTGIAVGAAQGGRGDRPPDR